MSDSAITVSSVSKRYKGANGEIVALDGISFEAAEGEIFGLIGPDGAGKTTMMRIAATLILPDSGSAKIRGLDAAHDYKEIRKIIGYMPNRFSLYQDLTVAENISFFAKIFGVNEEKNLDVISGIYGQIEPFKNRLAGKLSGGMKQKLALCCALIHCPEILLLDEPTTGVDPVSRREFWDILGQMKQSGMTVFVSTPYMDEAARCDKIAFIANGKILKNDSPKNIISAFPQKIYRATSSDMFGLLADARASGLAESAYSFGDCCHIVLKDGADIAKLRARLRTASGDVSISETSAGLEDCFMELNANERH